MHQVASWDELMQYVNDPGNGLVQSKKVNGVEMRVKFMPPDWLAHREIEQHPTYSKAQCDSILNIYKKSTTFLLTLGPDKEKTKGDIMFRDVSKIEEYNARALEMNFSMQEYVTLSTDKGTYTPVLAHLENVYGLTPGRNVILVFVPGNEHAAPLHESTSISIAYDDPFFGLGKNYFEFKKANIDLIPTLKQL